MSVAFYIQFDFLLVNLNLHNEGGTSLVDFMNMLSLPQGAADGLLRPGRKGEEEMRKQNDGQKTRATAGPHVQEARSSSRANNMGCPHNDKNVPNPPATLVSLCGNLLLVFKFALESPPVVCNLGQDALQPIHPSLGGLPPPASVTQTAAGRLPRLI